MSKSSSPTTAPLTSHPDVVSDFERIDPLLVQQAAAFAPAIFADVAGRRGALDGRIRPAGNGMRLAGSALTVEVRPGDCLTIHIALALARPGDVLIIDGKGFLGTALMGAIMATAAMKVGIAGLVIDGAIRDKAEVIEMRCPVFCAGFNANGPTKDTLGRIGHTVVVGGVAVKSGDLILGDDDGVVAIDRHRVRALLPLAQAKVSQEADRMTGIAAGQLFPSWLAASMAELGLQAPLA